MATFRWALGVLALVFAMATPALAQQSSAAGRIKIVSGAAFNPPRDAGSHRRREGNDARDPRAAVAVNAAEFPGVRDPGGARRDAGDRVRSETRVLGTHAAGGRSRGPAARPGDERHGPGG